MAKLLDGIDWGMVESLLRRYRAALRRNPAWRIVGQLTPRELTGLGISLPGLPGRPKGTGHVANDAELLSELEARVANGWKPTPAAMAILRARGVKAGVKGRADHLVRIWKREKSRRGF